MSDYIEGKRPVIEALRTHVPIECVLLADNMKRDSLVEDIERKARNAGVLVKTVRRRELDEKSERGSHQGVMAKTKQFNYTNVQVIIDAANAHAADHDGSALVVLLDHITDAGNLGAIARSAEVVGASGLIIPNKRSAHVTAATYKSSAGAISHINVCQVANLAQTIQRLKEADFWVAGASEHATDCIWDSNLKGKVALVMGNEADGLARLTGEICDFLVKLPQAGQVGSLNVAQASTACMYEYLRQNRA
ncbi:MAG: 23S rRNA (guanosine(2251)-2'-O)-methyltransferase RlmB [Raoultibacter sp.]